MERALLVMLLLSAEIWATGEADWIPGAGTRVRAKRSSDDTWVVGTIVSADTSDAILAAEERWVQRGNFSVREPPGRIVIARASVVALERSRGKRWLGERWEEIPLTHLGKPAALPGDSQSLTPAVAASPSEVAVPTTPSTARVRLRRAGSMGLYGALQGLQVSSGLGISYAGFALDYYLTDRLSVSAPVATPNSPTCGRVKLPRQSGGGQM